MHLNPADIFLIYCLLLFCLSFHEAAHALIADKMGDDTAKLLGRITLNPIPHIDLIGTVFLPIVALITGAALIGWGKPVPVNSYRFKDPRRGNLWVALAGPVSNFILACLFAIFLRGLFLVLPYINPASLREGTLLGDVIGVCKHIAEMGVVINLLLAFFNLIPVFPLDGGSVLRGLLPSRMVPSYDQFSRYSVIILLLLFVTGMLRYVMIPVKLVAQILLP